MGVGLREQSNYSTHRRYEQEIHDEFVAFLEGYHALQDALDSEKSGDLKESAVAQAVRATALPESRQVGVYLINPHITEITGVI